MIKYVFFDLDGTILPMDQSLFVNIYFKSLTEAFVRFGYDRKTVYDSIISSIGRMVNNTSDRFNEELFWEYMVGALGKGVLDMEDCIDSFYKNEFFNTKEACFENPLVRKTLDILKEKQKHLILATNPVFPLIASETRMQWSGALPEDFEYITTYSNSKRCKPNVEYYTQLAEKFACDPKESIMVGNDVGDDMPAKNAGWHVFLLTDCLLNRKNEDISQYPNGGYEELLSYIEELDKI